MLDRDVDTFDVRRRPFGELALMSNRVARVAIWSADMLEPRTADALPL